MVGCFAHEARIAAFCALVLFAFTVAACRGKGDYRAAAHIVQGIATAGGLKVFVSAHHDDTGEWPDSNEAAGLRPPPEYANGAVTSIAVGPGGVITITYDEQSGVDGGTVQLTPDASKPEAGTMWKCSTKSFEHLAELVPQCTYTP